MADTTAPEDETPTQRQARLRREKRQKKMAESGEDRLARIKALNGGIAPPAEILGGPTAPSGARMQASVGDPEEADIDTVSGAHTPNFRGAGAARGNGGMDMADNPFAAMLQMQGMGGGAGGGGQGGEGEDPMVRMMQQLTGMMGGNPQDPNDANQQPQIPPMLQALMGGSNATKDEQAKAPTTSSAYLWRIVHAVFACCLAVYITITNTFNGSALSRSQSVHDTSASAYGFGPRLFTLFTTFELLLQGSRFFLEKGELRGPGMLATVANSGMVPEPYAQYIRTAGRWIGIVQSIVSDAMVVVFVFGVLAWWGGKATQ